MHYLITNYFKTRCGKHLSNESCHVNPANLLEEQLVISLVHNTVSKIKKYPKRRHYHSLVAAALLTGGIFQFIAPVLADGTAAGTSINNTATATYQDPNNPGTTINATSNQVTVTVAKVAGITVTGSGITDTTHPGGLVTVGDSLYYNYSVTNVGNDKTLFRIPNLVTVTGPGTAGTVQISYDGGTTWTNISGSEVISTSIAPGGSVQVRVPVTVTAGANSGDIIGVQLGHTPGDAQNQLRIPDGGDVYTVDDPTATVTGDPVNGVREASATQKISVGSTAKTIALATVLKTLTNFNNGGNSQQINGDIITYGLALRVEQNDVTNTGITPAPLAGTSINVDGAAVTRILVSDAIPANTVLTGTPTAPPGWKVVYTNTATATTANQALWTSTPSGTVTRVGFVNDPTVITSVPTGQTISGFSIQVQVQGVANSATSATIGNIAQAFGTTSGDTSNTLITDDSGDQNPDNFNLSTKLITSTPDSGTVPTNPTSIDTANNNTGTSQPGGDANVYTITAAAASSVLNGPVNAPNATGPTSNNDDFTNKSALVPANTTPGSLINPSAVAFTNTVENTGQSAATISLLPTPPATAADLPTNSQVTITYGSISATYSYDGAKFNFVSGTGTSVTNPVQVSGLATGATANYGVEVQLPNSNPNGTTPLSTDTGKGFPVPITAFIGSVTVSGQNAVPAVSPPLANSTIDRIYTGFLQMIKQSKVLQGTGPAVQTSDSTFSTTPKHPAPGNIIQYQIQYTNISTPQAGTGNIILNASNVVITENGTQSPNNWALDNDNNGVIDTSNISGTAQDSNSGNITFFNGNPATTTASDQSGTTVTTDVTKYVDTVTGQVAPGASQTFTFQRKVN